MGFERFATFSDGTRVENPRFLRKAENGLKRRQRELSRKIRGSKNREKARLRVARAHERVFDQRKDFSHKVSTYLARNYGTIAIEDLNIKGMVGNHTFAKSINDAGWQQFLNMLVYKAEKAGGRVVKRGPFEPTTKKCSRCGAIRDMKLEDRIYKCDKCGLVIDRDQNAAINVLKGHTSGHGGINACGDGTSTPVSERDASPVVEAGTKCGNARNSTAGSLPL
jgi:putative transposase